MEKPIKEQEGLFGLWGLIETFNVRALEENPENPTMEDDFIVWFMRNNTLLEKPKNTKGRLLLEMAEDLFDLKDKQLKCLLAAHRHLAFLMKTLPERFFVTPEKCRGLKGVGRDQPGPLNLICLPGV